MGIWTDMIRVAAISNLLVILVLLFRSKIRQQERHITAIFICCVIGYLLVDWHLLEASFLWWPFLLLAFALPFFFWMFSRVIFNDHFRWQMWMIPVLLFSIVVNSITFMQHRGLLFTLSEGGSLILGLLSRTIALIFIIFAIIEATQNWREDLILARMRFRSLFMLIVGLLITFTILTEIAFSQSPVPALLDFIQKCFIAGLAFWFAINRLSLKPTFFRLEPMPTSTTTVVTPEEKQLLQRLTKMIEIEKVYRTEGLTIRVLAEKLEVKEYKVRRVINQALGFRNFNDFLNTYRIQEACELLHTTSKAEYNILEIAYQLGYTSLATFNRAFKTTTGMTPSAWRKNQ